MAARRFTIVSSMRPDGTRDSLPMGPEAIERAARLCRVWRGTDVADACSEAYAARGVRMRVRSPSALWLPEALRWLPEELRR